VSKAEIIERERRWAIATAIATLAAVGLFVASLVINATSFGADGEAEALRKIDHDSGLYMAAQIFRAAGAALLAFPLLYLFRAAKARSDAMRGQLIGVTVIAPLFLGAGALLGGIAFSDAASEFVGRGLAGNGDRVDKIAEHLIEEQSVRDLAGGMGLAGVLGFSVSMLYTCLWSMRVGLLTRFWGSLGMALGAVSFLFFQFALLWFVFAGLLFVGWVPGGRPPAWAAGEAIPWPAPGEEPGEPAAAEEPAPSQDDTGDVAGPAPQRGSRRKRKRRR
jgi:hypothetical protein